VFNDAMIGMFAVAKGVRTTATAAPTSTLEAVEAGAG
jgi:hypothetical protein